MMIECVRILRPNGVFASSVWEELGWIKLMEEAAATISGAPKYPKTADIMGLLSDGKWNNRSWLVETLEKQGLVNIQIDVQPMPLEWLNVQEFMDSTFPKMMGMFPLKLWSKDDQERFEPKLFPALESFLTEKYGKDSTFELEMVAIIATARKPWSAAVWL
jgi:SAM-dependent methyltransferase